MLQMGANGIEDEDDDDDDDDDHISRCHSVIILEGLLITETQKVT
jgi:hypothetical protein